MIGVAISTYRRPQVLARALAEWATHLGGVAELVVIHDEAGDGVAASKNRSIAALMDAGCTELFLVDDDLWPVTDGWWRPYVDSSERHLMHCWGASRFIREVDGLTVWKWARGVMLYATREVVERVGGMRVEFDGVGGEHIEFSRRIHAAGLTRFEFADSAAARTGIWHALDYKREIQSSMSHIDRYGPLLSEKRHRLYEQFRGHNTYVRYD